jgi:hypothetical protein
MISSEQEVLLEKIMLEAPGVPCFLLGHSTGGAVVLKVRLVKLNPFFSSIFRPDLDTDPTPLGPVNNGYPAGRRMVQSINKIAWLEWFG